MRWMYVCAFPRGVRTAQLYDRISTSYTPRQPVIIIFLVDFTHLTLTLTHRWRNPDFSTRRASSQLFSPTNATLTNDRVAARFSSVPWLAPHMLFSKLRTMCCWQPLDVRSEILGRWKWYYHTCIRGRSYIHCLCLCGIHFDISFLYPVMSETVRKRCRPKDSEMAGSHLSTTSHCVKRCYWPSEGLCHTWCSIV